jgi:beta-lactamase regulating signal transducer with metallopeptidase domain
MGPVFYLLLNMGITASAIGLTVLLVRAALGRRLPALARYALWGLVLARLLLPFSLPSEASALNPVARFVLPIASWRVGLSDLTMTNSIRLIDGYPSPAATNLTGAANSWFPHAVRFKTNELDAAFNALGTVWLAGALAVAVAAAVLYGLAALRLGRARPVDDGGLLAECAALIGIRRKVGLYLSDAVDSPVAFGILRPRVVVPQAALADRETLRLVLLHELTHIRRGDNLRVLLFLFVCAHWFNPLIWLFFLLSGKDMELACDAAVLRRLDRPQRRQYAEALLALAAGRQPWLSAAFGRSAVRQRILGIVQYRRVTILAAVLSAALLLALAAVLLTNPVAG